MRIIVSGGWGYGNLGDEVIAKCTIALLKKYFPEAEIIVTGYDEQDFYFHHKIHAEVSVHRILEDIKFDGNDTVNQVVDSPESYGLGSFCSLFDENTLFVMSGGGYFDGNWNSQFWSRIIEIALAEKMGAKIALIGQSIGPVVNKVQLEALRNSLQKCDYISVRDEESQQFLQGLHPCVDVSCCCDLALTISEIYHPVKNTDQTAPITLVLQNYARYVSNGLKRNHIDLYKKIIKRITLEQYRYDYAVQRLVSALLSANEDIQLVLNVRETPRYGCKHFYQYAERTRRKAKSDKVTVKKELSADEFCDLLAGGKAIISLKMHPLIISASYNIPTFCISQHYKMDGFMKWIGRSAYCYRNSSFDPMQVAKDVFASYAELPKESEYVLKRKEDIHSMMREMQALFR